MSEKKYMSIKDFKNLGFLQELNRQFLHPLGLSLSVTGNQFGYKFDLIQDCREDAKGIIFEEGVLDKIKFENVEEERKKHIEARLKLLGSVEQPIP